MSYMGQMRYHEGDYKTALEYYIKAAELGNAEAHYCLSVMYHEGGGVVKDKKKNIYHLEKAAIGGVYATTELHMLADESPAFEQTAIFLEQRVRELETMAGAASSMGSGGPGMLSPEMAVAATSVATSLGGALVSLAQPAALGAARPVRR